MAEGDAHPQAPPTSGQRAFIAASRRTADRIAWLQRSVLAVGLVIAVLASFALVSRSQAIARRNTAIYNQTVAEGLEFGATNTPRAAQLNLAAYHLRPGQNLASLLLSTENTPLSSALAAGTSPFPRSRSPRMATRWPAAISMARSGSGMSPIPRIPPLLGQPLVDVYAALSVAFSPDRRTLAAADTYGRIRLWDVTDPAHPHLLSQFQTKADGASIYSMAFSPDGRTLVAGDYVGALWRWDVTDPAHPNPLGRPLNGGDGSTYSVAFSSDGHTLADGTNSGTIWLWDVADPAHPHLLGQPQTGVPAPLCRWRSAPTAARWPAARLTARSGCGMSPIPPARSPVARPDPERRHRDHGSIRWRSAPTATHWPAATLTAPIRMWDVADLAQPPDLARPRP